MLVYEKVACGGSSRVCLAISIDVSPLVTCWVCMLRKNSKGTQALYFYSTIQFGVLSYIRACATSDQPFTGHSGPAADCSPPKKQERRPAGRSGNYPRPLLEPRYRTPLPQEGRVVGERLLRKRRRTRCCHPAAARQGHGGKRVRRCEHRGLFNPAFRGRLRSPRRHDKVSTHIPFLSLIWRIGSVFCNAKSLTHRWTLRLVV